MKEYEIFKDMKVPKGLNTIVRLDGRRFHNLSKKLNLKKPYDKEFTKNMVKTSEVLFKEFSPLFIYTFSDEISILLKSIPFNGRIEKIDSVFGSLASSSLTLSLNKSFKKEIILSFDSRVVLLNDDNVVSYFKWRQDEAFRNYTNSYGYWTLREEYSREEASAKLKGMKNSEIHEYLFKEKGINLDKNPIWQKRGICLYKNKNNEIIIDKNIKKFSNPFFCENILNNGKNKKKY
ncbi:MAG: guanylyltransferase [Methanobrevibacter sp.]|nr:guanylyltransferase [Methanobrevibacter sp.]